MQRHDDINATPLYENNERFGYMGSSQYYEPPASQTFQQQTYNPPMPDSASASQQQMYDSPISSYGSASYGQPSFAEAPPLSDSRFAAILCYSFGWLTGLLFLLFGGQNRFIRFHALQSLVFFGAINVIDFGLFNFVRAVADYSHLLGFAGVCGFLLLNFIGFVGWIVVMVQAGHGKYFRMPFVGELIAQRLGLHSTPRW